MVLERAEIIKLIEDTRGLLQRKEIDGAKSLFEKLLKLDYPDNAIAQHIGTLAIQLDYDAYAINIFSELHNQEPLNTAYMDGLSVAYIKTTNLPEAIAVLKQMLSIDPNHVNALVNLAGVYTDFGRYQLAVDLLERARNFEPENAHLLLTLTKALRSIGRYEEALEYALKASRISPDNPSVQYIIGILNSELGKKDNAIRYLSKAIELKRYYGGAFYSLAYLRKFKIKDDPLITQMEEVLKEAMPPDDRRDIHFALGKVYSDLSIADKSFDHFRKGNLLKKSATEPDKPEKLLKKVQSITSGIWKNRDSAQVNLGSKPVFIFGMPRTGSTLTEQILTTDESVVSIGESLVTHEMYKRIFLPLDKSSNQIKAELGQSQLENLSREYFDAVKKTVGDIDRKRVLNKSPGNWGLIGFLYLLFPDAKFVHTIRNPMDTCLSCYFQPFGDIVWADDLKTLAEHYSLYRDTMEFWKKTLPENTIFDLHYESLVENPEAEAKKLMEFCELDWNPACLDFFKKDNRVATASLWQVRQPIYKTSKEKWKLYADHLEGLAKGLADYLSEEDVSFLKSRGMDVKKKQNFFKKLIG